MGGCVETGSNVGLANIQNHPQICYSCFKKYMKAFTAKSNNRKICQGCTGLGATVVRHPVHNYPLFKESIICS